MPFSKLHKQVAKPKPLGYPKELITIGDRLRAWRIDNGLLQEEVARLIGVCEDSVVGWEKRGIIPIKRTFEKISRLIRQGMTNTNLELDRE